MKNVYLVVEKRFYNENGRDYAFPVSYSDIWTFSNREKALKAARFLMKQRGNAYEEIKPNYKAAGNEALLELAERTYNVNGVRYAVTVEKQKVCTYDV